MYLNLTFTGFLSLINAISYIGINFSLGFIIVEILVGEKLSTNTVCPKGPIVKSFIVVKFWKIHTFF